MTSQTEQIAASQQRQLVPKEWQLGFGDWANDTLESLAKDPNANVDASRFARWELAYRRAFGILLMLNDETGQVVWVETDKELDEIKAASVRVKARAAEIMRKRSAPHGASTGG